ncbi:MAG: hypothetical protein R3B91_13900 [Planctomycetaceae bacterium]
MTEPTLKELFDLTGRVAAHHGWVGVSGVRVLECGGERGRPLSSAAVTLSGLKVWPTDWCRRKGKLITGAVGSTG